LIVRLVISLQERNPNTRLKRKKKRNPGPGEEEGRREEKTKNGKKNQFPSEKEDRMSLVLWLEHSRKKETLSLKKRKQPGGGGGGKLRRQEREKDEDAKGIKRRRRRLVESTISKKLLAALRMVRTQREHCMERRYKKRTDARKSGEENWIREGNAAGRRKGNSTTVCRSQVTATCKGWAKKRKAGGEERARRQETADEATDRQRKNPAQGLHLCCGSSL